MNKIKVCVIYGGISTEHEISIISAKNVIENLDKSKYDISKIFINKNGDFFDGSNKQIKDINSKFQNADVIFPILHGIGGEDGTIQGMLEMLSVRYIGCKVLASSIAMDKVYTNVIFEKARIPHAKYIYLKNENTYINEEFDEIKLNNSEIIELVKEKLGFPIFVKPSNSGSSVGITKAKNEEELIRAIQKAAMYDCKILIEEAINGREVECAVLGNDEIEASGVGEILPAQEFYSYDAKYNDECSKIIIPANIDENKKEEIRKLAIKGFKAIDGKGLARCDFFIEEKTGKVYINEINTMPGFTNISMYPKLWEHEGVRYSALLDKLISLALE